MPGTAAPVVFAGRDGAVDQSRAQKRPCRVVNENEGRGARRKRLEPGAHRSLPRRAAGNRRGESFPGRRSPRGMNRLSAPLITGCTDADAGMLQERAQRRPDHRLAGNVAILLWNAAAGALAAARCDDNSGHQTRHETPDPDLGSR